MKLFSRHPDDSTGSVRGGVLQAPSTYVKMRIAGLILLSVLRFQRHLAGDASGGGAALLVLIRTRNRLC